jgi:hypothetical protein
MAGMASLSANVVLSSTRQRLVPGPLLGRVNATYRLVALGTLPLGALLGGTIGDLISLRAVFTLAGGLFLTGLLLLRGLTDRALHGCPDPIEILHGDTMMTMDEHVIQIEIAHRTGRLRRLASRSPGQGRSAQPPPATTPMTHATTTTRAQMEIVARKISAELPHLDVRLVDLAGEPACLVRAGDDVAPEHD